jgi:hypothetical protein
MVISSSSSLISPLSDCLATVCRIFCSISKKKRRRRVNLKENRTKTTVDWFLLWKLWEFSLPKSDKNFQILLPTIHFSQWWYLLMSCKPDSVIHSFIHQTKVIKWCPISRYSILLIMNIWNERQCDVGMANGKVNEKYLDICKFFKTVIVESFEQLQVNCCGSFEFCYFDQGFSNNSDEDQNHRFNTMWQENTEWKKKQLPLIYSSRIDNAKKHFESMLFDKIIGTQEILCNYRNCIWQHQHWGKIRLQKITEQSNKWVPLLIHHFSIFNKWGNWLYFEQDV